MPSSGFVCRSRSSLDSLCMVETARPVACAQAGLTQTLQQSADKQEQAAQHEDRTMAGLLRHQAHGIPQPSQKSVASRVPGAG